MHLGCWGPREASRCHTPEQMRAGPTTFRAAVLIVVAALVLHELRYLIGYGELSGEAIGSPGHAYLPVAAAGAAGLLALALGQLVAAVSRAVRTGAGERGPGPLAPVWAASTAALLLTYGGQELVEGVLATGHPAGLGSLAGNGGLVVLPLALVLGAAVALLLRGASAAVRAAAHGAVPPESRAPRGVRLPRPPRIAPPAPVLARHLAGRAPPQPS